MVDLYMTFFFLLLLTFQGTAIVAMKLDLSFSALTGLFSILLILICGAVLLWKKKSWVKKEFNWKKSFLELRADLTAMHILIVLLFIAQIGVAFYFAPIVQEDNTMEIVQTTLTTNSIHMYNSMTGQASVNGIAMQGKFMVLPLFYAYICRIFRMNPAVLLYRVIPVWILLVSYLVYAHLAQQLFRTEEDKPDSFAVTVFIVLYGALLLFGDFLFTTIPYRIFHCAWTGETLVVAITLPFIISQCLQLKRNRTFSLLSIGISGIAVFILVSLQKGITYLALTGIILSLVFLMTKVRRPKTCKNS